MGKCKFIDGPRKNCDTCLMTSTRGIPQTSVSTIVPTKTPELTLISSAPNFDSQLSRYQDGITDTLDAVLSWLNSHFDLAPPLRSANGRTITPDTTTLIAAGTGLAISSSYPVTFSIPTSAVAASSSAVTVYQLPLPAGTLLDAVYLWSPTATAGSATLTIGANTLTLGAGVQQLLSPAPALLQVQPIKVTSTSAWAIPAGTIYVTLYVSEGVS